MSDEFSSRVRADISRARFTSFVNQVLSVLSGQPTKLLSHDEVKEKLRIGGPIYRGVQTVRVDQIAGSLNRYHEFDRVFLPVSAAGITQTCAHCHESQMMNAKFMLPKEMVKSFLDSYHGLSGSLGDVRAANCASCHGPLHPTRSTGPCD